jgi:hypothetical protein
MQGSDGDVAAALQSFHALPGTKSYLIRAGQGGSLGHAAHQPRRFLFTASAYKTFVFAQYLREVEAGLLSEDEQLVIDAMPIGLATIERARPAGRLPPYQ